MFRESKVEEITAFALTIKLFRVRLEIKPIVALVLMTNAHLWCLQPVTLCGKARCRSLVVPGNHGDM
jgi:hypothetical protein